MMISSMLCQQKHFSTEWYAYWVERIYPDIQNEHRRGGRLNRKIWEWCAIAQALAERRMLMPGRRGIGFAVGQEPLASLFAAHGAELTVSDFQGEVTDNRWANTGQFGRSLVNTNWPQIFPFEEYEKLVEYRDIDMRSIDHIPKNLYDFSWSSCAFEHLGSLDLGLKFLLDSFQCLKPGGIAVHTTEFNVSSNEDTMETGENVIYRRRDIEAFDLKIRRLACAIENLNFDAGFEQHDIAFDYPPYYINGREHVKLLLWEWVSTSLILIIRKAA